MYYAPYMPLTIKSKIESKRYFIVHPFYNGNANIGFDIGDYILSHNSILIIDEILYTECYVSYRCIDTLYGGTKIIYPSYTKKNKSIILKGFVKDDLIDIFKMINYTLNTELVAMHNDLGKINNNVIDSKVLTNYSSQYIIDQTDYDIEAPLYVAEINDDGYVLFNSNYLLTVNNDLKIENVISYFNFVCSLIDNNKYTYKNTIINLGLNISEHFLNKSVIDIYEK